MIIMDVFQHGLTISCLAVSFILFWKSFIIAFFTLNSHPREYDLPEDAKAIAEPTWYLWYGTLWNILAVYATFWIFAGVYEAHSPYLIPGLYAYSTYLIVDLGTHLGLFLTNAAQFHILMYINFGFSILGALSMIMFYIEDKRINELEEYLERVASSRISSFPRLTSWRI